MGDLRPDNGGHPPDDGGPAHDGLPDLPPEWGVVVIPDDPAELAAEAEAIRRELRQAAATGSPVVRRPGVGTRRATEPTGLGIPLTIMLVAIVITLASLFVVTWNHQPASVMPPAGSPATSSAGTPFADLALTDPDGRLVTLRDLLPAIVMLVDQCACTDLVLATAGAAPTWLTVVAVGSTPPAIDPPPANLRLLGDRAGLIRTRYAASVSPAASRATVLIADRHGTVVRTVPAAGSVADIIEALAALPVVTPAMVTPAVITRAAAGSRSGSVQARTR
jgi:hypothetical protein